jgi:hypothetical protein
MRLLMLRRLSTFLLIGFISACTAHNPFDLTPVTDSKAAPSAKAYPAQTNRIRVTREALPTGAAYEVLGTIDAGSNWYGPDEDAEKMMADRARAMGADAIVEVKLWHQPSGFSWAAPHGSGVAVKLTDPRSVNLETLPGGWF